VRSLLISILVWGDQLHGCDPGIYSYRMEVDCPPRVHFFLWLLSHNKLLTRDNRSKRMKVDDLSYINTTEPLVTIVLFKQCWT
jgi:hypothetical protein